MSEILALWRENLEDISEGEFLSEKEIWIF